MRRIMSVATIVATVALAGASDLFAQRRGFIIGFGIGTGVTSYSYFASKESEFGFATDLKIGAQVSKSVQVYYLGRTNWFKPRTETVAAGISALGLTYVLPTAPVHISGGLGLATFLPLCYECSGPTGGGGFGVTGGVGWEFSDRWLFDFAVTHGAAGDVNNVWTARVGISILSH